MKYVLAYLVGFVIALAIIVNLTNCTHGRLYGVTAGDQENCHYFFTRMTTELPVTCWCALQYTTEDEKMALVFVEADEENCLKKALEPLSN